MQEIVADLTYKMFNGDQQAISDFVRAEPNLAQRILEKIKEFIATLTGNTREPNEMQKRLQKAQELFEQALKNRETNGQRDNGHQYMIILDDSNVPYVKADRALGLGTDPSKWSTAIFKYIRDQIRGGKDVLIRTVEGRNTLLTTAAQKHLKSKGNMASQTYETKLNAAGHIDEIIAVSTDINPEEANRPDDGRHPELAANGWRYNQAIFEDYDGQFYRIEISIGQSREGEVAYNIGRVEKINLPTNNRRLTEGRSPLDYAPDTSAGGIGSGDLSYNSIENIAQPARDVNPQQQTAPAAEIQTDDGGASYSLPETDNKYLQAIESDDLDTAQQLVDQAAEAAGCDRSSSRLPCTKQRNLRHHAGFAGCRRVFQFCSAGCFTCFCALPAPWRA